MARALWVYVVACLQGLLLHCIGSMALVSYDQEHGLAR